MSSTLQAQSPSLNVAPTLGALFLGTVASAALWGVTTLQTYQYFKTFVHDPFRWKLAVSVIWIFGSAAVSSLTGLVYIYAITDYGNALVVAEEKVPLALVLTLMFGATSTALTFGLYAFRIWTLASSTSKLFKGVASLIWLATLGSLGGSIASVVIAEQSPNIPSFVARHFWVLVYPYVLGFGSDVMISVSMICLLIQARRRSVSHRHGSARLLEWWLKWTLQTGLITAIVGGFGLVFISRQTDNFIWVALQSVRSRLFSVAFMSSLMSRQTLREAAPGRDGAYTNEWQHTATQRYTQSAQTRNTGNNMHMHSVELGGVGRSHVVTLSEREANFIPEMSAGVDMKQDIAA